MKNGTLVERLSRLCAADYVDKDFVLIDDARALPFGSKVDFLEDLAILVFVRTGYMHINVGGEIRHVSPMHLLLCRPGLHIYNPSYSEDFSGHAILLTMRYGQSITTVVGNIWNYLVHIDSSPVIELPLGVQPLLLQYYSLLREEARRSDSMFASIVVSSILKAMLYSLINDLRHVVRSSDVNLNAVSSGYTGSTQTLALFNKFMGILVNEHCTERKIDYYAKRLCVTNKYLSTVCKQVSNRTAHEWINDAIVNGVENCLRHTDKSIKEIAMHYGFTTLSFFSRFVKEHLGAPPSALRKQR